KVFTAGEDGERWYYAMELVEGATLAAVADRLRARNPDAATVPPGGWQEMLDAAREDARRAEKPLGDVPVNEEGLLPGAASRRADAYRFAAGGGGRDYVRHVAELIRQVAGAAHALHEAGVTHRDIKPSNIIVTADGTRAILMDLGLAQLADEAE